MFAAALETVLTAWRISKGEWIWATITASVAAFFYWLVIELAVKQITETRVRQENLNE
jgi:hypothetical protein